jgi:hypothetical protein
MMTNNVDWISVKDRLPENGERVIIFCKNILAPKMYFARILKGKNKTEGPWRNCDTGIPGGDYSLCPWIWKEGTMEWTSQDVIFWSYLPDAPVNELCGTRED